MFNRLEQNIQAMTRRFPSFSFGTTTAGGKTVGHWTGTVQPIRTTSGLLELLDDLKHDCDVYIVGTEVRHLPGCVRSHCWHPWIDKVKDVSTSFQLEIIYAGDDALPRTWVITPAIPLDKRLHMWRDGSICAFLHSSDIWSSSHNTVADYVPHVLVWLIKWMVYSQSNVWIGAQHQATPHYHLTILRGKDLCWCGSGKEYRFCHQKIDEVDAGIVPPSSLRPRFRRH